MNRKIRSVRAATGRCVRTASVLAIALAGLSAAAVPASASPAGPHANFSGFSFTGGQGAITGGGHKWDVQIVTSGFGGGIDAIGVGISIPHLGGLEQHSWGGVVPTSAVSISSSGVMTIASGSGLAPIAKLTLAFKPT